MTALVLSAGGLWAAWEVGVWSVLRERFRPDLIVGASAGAWNGWAIAGGCTPLELARPWARPGAGGGERLWARRTARRGRGGAAGPSRGVARGGSGPACAAPGRGGR